MSDATFCVMCGKSHVFGTPCDPIWLEWVATRRREIAAGVSWRDATPMPHNQEPSPEHDRYIATEHYVRGVLRTLGQPDDADDPRLVGRLASKILRALPDWTRSDSSLRRPDAEIESGN